LATTTTQERTELPTGKRLNEARKRGQIPKSRDLTAVSVLITGGAAIYLSRNLIFSNFRQILENAWSKESFSNPGIFAANGFFINIVVSIFVMLAPVVLAIVATAVIVNVGQMKGFILSFEALRISFGNLNPINGFQRMFSLRSLTELINGDSHLRSLFGSLAGTRCSVRAGRAGCVRFFEPHGNALSQAFVSSGRNYAQPESARFSLPEMADQKRPYDDPTGGQGRAQAKRREPTDKIQNPQPAEGARQAADVLEDTQGERDYHQPYPLCSSAAL
jgi:type III secretory pathway component EscU